MKKNRRRKDESVPCQTLKSLGDAASSIQAVANDIQGAASVVQMCLEADDALGALRTGDLLFDWTRRLNRMARENAKATRLIALSNARALIAEIRRTPEP